MNVINSPEWIQFESSYVKVCKNSAHFTSIPLTLSRRRRSSLSWIDGCWLYWPALFYHIYRSHGGKPRQDDKFPHPLHIISTHIVLLLLLLLLLPTSEPAPFCSEIKAPYNVGEEWKFNSHVIVLSYLMYITCGCEWVAVTILLLLIIIRRRPFYMIINT